MVVNSAEKFKKLVFEFGKVCEKRKLKVNVWKCKWMRSRTLEMLKGRLDVEKR